MIIIKRIIGLIYFVPLILAIIYNEIAYLLIYWIILIIKFLKMIFKEERKNKLKKIRGIKGIWITDERDS